MTPAQQAALYAFICWAYATWCIHNIADAKGRRFLLGLWSLSAAGGVLLALWFLWSWLF